MKHIFVVNPTAGEGSLQKTLEEQLQKFAGTKEYEIYATKGPGDATLFVRNYVSAHPEESLRFYACGGDGSINEVATGLVSAKNASMSAEAGMITSSTTEPKRIFWTFLPFLTVWKHPST